MPESDKDSLIGHLPTPASPARSSAIFSPPRGCRGPSPPHFQPQSRNFPARRPPQKSHLGAAPTPCVLAEETSKLPTGAPHDTRFISSAVTLSKSIKKSRRKEMNGLKLSYVWVTGGDALFCTTLPPPAHRVQNLNRNLNKHEFK